jgi:3-hydroxy-9,10-secoandrosta-1,3,5(10)-triene-9,17-dione monooxygenase reductase component
VIVTVDLGLGGRVRLREPEDFSAFQVECLVADGKEDWPGLEAALRGTAEVRDDHAYFSPAGLEGLAGKTAEDEEWQSGFRKMIEYAETKGWLDDAGSIAAHVQWETEVVIEPDEFRRVLGHYPTGVAVLTAEHPEGPVGMACNSLTSVSLDPPLVAVCPAKSSDTWPAIRSTGRFLINLMADDHRETVVGFARKGIDRFESVTHHPRRCGPALDGAAAWVDCIIESEYEAGDHMIVVARVKDLETSSGSQPLVFYQGRYGTFSPRSGGGES